jgi:hypothetical protein
LSIKQKINYDSNIDPINAVKKNIFIRCFFEKGVENYIFSSYTLTKITRIFLYLFFTSLCRRIVFFAFMKVLLLVCLFIDSHSTFFIYFNFDLICVCIEVFTFESILHIHLICSLMSSHIKFMCLFCVFVLVCESV